MLKRGVRGYFLTVSYGHGRSFLLAAEVCPRTCPRTSAVMAWDKLRVVTSRLMLGSGEPRGWQARGI